jgi:hypothetical protein
MLGCYGQSGQPVHTASVFGSGGHVTIASFAHMYVFRCNKRNACKINADTSNFFDACRGVRKYLFVQYFCVDKKENILDRDGQVVTVAGRICAGYLGHISTVSRSIHVLMHLYEVVNKMCHGEHVLNHQLCPVQCTNVYVLIVLVHL